MTITAPSLRKAKPRKGPRTGSAAFARAIDTSADGKAPHAVRLWRAGWNETDKGPLNFTPRSAKLVMAAFARRGNPLVFDYEHESTVPLEQRGGCPMKGVASADRAGLEIREDDDGEPELWATGIGWTDEARRQIEARERTQISPISRYDLDTKEITAIENVALCREGATHQGTLLASAGKGTSMGLEEIIQKIAEAMMAGDFETAENLVQQAEAMDGGGDSMAVKMAKACMAAPKLAAPPPPPGPGVGEEKPKPAASSMVSARLAASREGVDAYARALVGEMEARTTAAERRAANAEKEAKVGRVEGLIAASRDCFDAIDEREHLAAADPERTRKHIASVTRKRAEGTLAASRPGPTVTEAKPPKPANKPGGEDETFGLNAMEIAAAAQHGVDLKTFAASKERIAKSAAARRGN